MSKIELKEKLGDSPYISGPMTGIKNYNREEFFNVSIMLKDNFKVESINPHVLTENLLEMRGLTLEDVEKISYEEYLEYDIKVLKAKATSLVLIPGWQNSNGARVELKTAQEKGIPILEMKNGQLGEYTGTTHIKSNSGKLPWGKFPFDLAEGALKVLVHGAEKYDWDNWKNAGVEKGISMYTDALIRHSIDMAKGDIFDKDSNLMHCDHIIANALFLSYFFKKKIENNEEN